MDTDARQLVFNGAVVLLLGLLCGLPYGRAINRRAPEHTVRSWRLAHASIVMGAILMFAIAAVLSQLRGDAVLKEVVALSLIVSSYAFCLSLPLAAIVGHRGLSFGGPVSAKLVYMGNMIGALSSLVAAIVFLYLAYVAL